MVHLSIRKGSFGDTLLNLVTNAFAQTNNDQAVDQIVEKVASGKLDENQIISEINNVNTDPVTRATLSEAFAEIQTKEVVWQITEITEKTIILWPNKVNVDEVGVRSLLDFMLNS